MAGRRDPATGPCRPARRSRATAPAFQRRLDALERSRRDWSPERVGETLSNGVEATRSVPAALHAFLRHPRSFSGAVCHAVTLRGDTDTIAAMTGVLAGAALGASAIPGAWRSRLEEPDRLSTWPRNCWRAAARDGPGHGTKRSR